MPSSVARQLLATFVCKRNICPDRPLVFPYSIQNLASLGLAELRRGGPRRAHPFSERTEIAMSHRKHVATLVCNKHICPTRLRILPYSIQKNQILFVSACKVAIGHWTTQIRSLGACPVASKTLGHWTSPIRCPGACPVASKTLGHRTSKIRSPGTCPGA